MATRLFAPVGDNDGGCWSISSKVNDWVIAILEAALGFQEMAH